MRARILQHALGGLPGDGIHHPGNQGGGGRVDREDAH